MNAKKALEKLNVFKKPVQTKRGVAGLDVFLTVITFLFMIGLIVMVFVIAGGRLQTVAADDLDDQDAVDVINATKLAIGGATDWFDIFIVLAALVVLILLVVIIVSAVRSQGMMGTGGA